MSVLKRPDDLTQKPDRQPALAGSINSVKPRGPLVLMEEGAEWIANA
jgi:hypothetical protein